MVFMGQGGNFLSPLLKSLLCHPDLGFRILLQYKELGLFGEVTDYKSHYGA